MSRHAGILLLAVMVAFAGRVVCPRGVMSCTVMQEASHDCCAGGEALSRAECCCQPTQQLAEAPADFRPHSIGSVALTGWHVGDLDAALRRTAHLYRCGRGIGPPETPVTRHTTLIL